MNRRATRPAGHDEGTGSVSEHQSDRDRVEPSGQATPAGVDATEATSAAADPGTWRCGLSRRTVIKSAFAFAAVGGVFGLGGSTRPARPLRLSAYSPPVKSYTLVGTDGWVSMPVQAQALPPFFPDNLAPSNGNTTGDLRKDMFSTYVFGFRNATAYNPGTAVTTSQLLVNNLKNHVQISAPLLHAQVGQDLRLTLFNLGMGGRPDLFDSHTIHFHGFANQIAYFDGVPDASLSVPPGQSLNYRYLPVDAGTYMYHCHVEDVEHVQMGMNGMVFIAPRKGQNYAYDVPGDRTADPLSSSRFDRQFTVHLSEVFPQGHYGDSHIQDTDWTDFNGYFRLMNGRAWPDTIKPSAGDYPNGEPGDPSVEPAGTGDVAVDAHRLRFQPLSSLIQGESGEYVLIRVSHLGYEQHSLVLPGLPVTIIGQDAKFLGDKRDGYYANYAYTDSDPLKPQRVPDATRGNIEVRTNRIDLGPGESRDLLVGPLPSVSVKTVFPFYDREFGFIKAADTADSSTGYGGMRTEVHVYPKDSLTRPGSDDVTKLLASQDRYTVDVDGNQRDNFTKLNDTWVYADGSPLVQTFPGKLYKAS